MAGISEVGTQSFDFYEGIRIFVPATAALALIEAVHRTLIDGSGTLLTDNLGAAIGAVLFIGLLLYFLDIPTKSAAYRAGQPADELAQFRDRLLATSEIHVVNAYFVLLDTTIPPQIRARALYMGSIFRIGLEIILLAGLSALGLLTYALYAEAEATARPELVASYCQMCLVALAVVVLGSVALDAKRERPKVGWRASLLRTLRNVPTSLGPVGAGVVAAATGLTWLAIRLEDVSWLRIAGPALFALVWVSVQIKGRPAFGSDQKPADGVTNAVLFAAAAASAVITRMALKSDGAVLSGRLEFAGWLALLPLVALLIAARGHEKRLKGAYSTQRTWIKLHTTEIERALGLTADGNGPADLGEPGADAQSP